MTARGRIISIQTNRYFTTIFCRCQVFDDKKLLDIVSAGCYHILWCAFALIKAVLMTPYITGGLYENIERTGTCEAEPLS